MQELQTLSPKGDRATSAWRWLSAINHMGSLHAIHCAAHSGFCVLPSAFCSSLAPSP
jgi:hypothetical protein